MLRRIREVFISGHFARLVLGRSFSSFGSTLAFTALAVYIYQRTGSAKAVGLTELITAFPAIFLGLPAGAWCDRHDRKKVMVGSVALQTAAWALLALRPSLPVLYFLLMISSGAGTFYGPAMTASIPHLVPKDRLLRANSLTETALQVVSVLAPVAGGAGVALLGFPVLALFNAFTFLVAGLVIVSLPIPKRERSHRGSGLRDMWEATAEGLRVIRANRVLAVFLTGQGLYVFAAGAQVVLLVVFVTQVLHADAARFGGLVSLIALGSIAGALVPSFLEGRLGRSRLLAVTLLAVGFVMMGIGVCRSFVLFAVLLTTIGLLQTSMSVVVDTWLMQIVPDALLGRVFASLGMIMNGSRMVAMAVGATLSDAVGVANVYAGAGMTALAGAAIAAVVVAAAGERERRTAARPESSSQ